MNEADKIFANIVQGAVDRAHGVEDGDLRGKLENSEGGLGELGEGLVLAVRGVVACLDKVEEASLKNLLKFREQVILASDILDDFLILVNKEMGRKKSK